MTKKGRPRLSIGRSYREWHRPVPPAVQTMDVIGHETNEVPRPIAAGGRRPRRIEGASSRGPRDRADREPRGARSRRGGSGRRPSGGHWLAKAMCHLARKEVTGPGCRRGSAGARAPFIATDAGGDDYADVTHRHSHSTSIDQTGL